MKLALMQPYFFPYLGYFQLINAVDTFVIYDDVQYIKGGWINRNRILLNKKCFNIVLPVKKDSMQKKINERVFVEDSLKFKIKILNQIEHAYKRAPFFEQVFPFISRLILFEEQNISKFNTSVLTELCEVLKISSKIFLSSGIKNQGELIGEERIIYINTVMDSKIYVNSKGGIELYQKESFFNKGIELKFLKTDPYIYKQFDNDFIPDLSIIDLLMFNSSETIKYMLNSYHLE